MRKVVLKTRAMPEPIKGKVSFKKFKEMVDRHDLTYNYSDDGSVYRAGQRSFDNIKETAKQFPAEKVIKVWNDMVDRSISPGHRQPFYWHRQW